MDRETFYKEIVRRGVYATFNELRTALFGKLATDSHIPISYNKLDEVLMGCKAMPNPLMLFVKTHIDEGDRFRYHCCEIEGMYVHYFVDVTKKLDGEDDAAVHFQWWDYDQVGEYDAVSAIVLYENHPSIQPTNYPKIIKHELSHAAIEFVIHNELRLSSYYFCDTATQHDDADACVFVEFICDLIPYVSSPSKKENGINKFISESEECFGYDAEEGKPAEFVHSVINTMGESEEEFVEEEPPYEEFKSLKDKYSFILRKTDGRNRCELLGITKSMYYDKEMANIWYHTILDILGDADDKDTKDAIGVLDHLYENMVEE